MITIKQSPPPVVNVVQGKPSSIGVSPGAAVPGPRGPEGPEGPPPDAASILAAVATYLLANPPPAGQNGVDGNDGQPGANATPEQVAAAVAAYLADNPPPAGADGSSWFVGSGEPTLDAKAADLYLDAETGDVWQMA